MGTPPPRVPEAFQGSRGESCERGIQGGGGTARKGYFLFSVSFFVCVKNGYPLSESSSNLGTPLGNVRNGYPPF